MKSLRKTKIVGTIGPASENRLEELFDAGLNVCRVNYSHGSWDEQKEKTEAILKIREEFNKNSSVEVFIIPMGVKIEALDLANKLREMGINVEIEMKDRKLKRSLDFANRENIPYVIILGEDEINNKKFVLKDMFGSNNIDVSMDNLDVIKDCLK